MGLLKTWLSLLVFFSTQALAGEIEFRTKQITVKNIPLKVAVADNTAKRSRGLMFVSKWDKYQGMIFIFDNDQKRSFWMRNTLLPLSLGFYDGKKKLLEIKDLSPAKSLAQKEVESVQSSEKARYVLEVPQGWFKKNKVEIGSGFKGL
ncbi:MAG: DUF192 domain-containing protein [Bdellovibrionales bacterium]